MFRFLLIVLVPVLLFLSCEKNNTFIDTPLDFSLDTIHFDTVFTTIGSTSRELRVKNLTNSKLAIDEIYLAGGQNSFYRLNIDGEPGYIKKGLTIYPGDSLYIFVDVIIDPTNQNNPVAVTDSIIFIASGKTMQVQLIAWGQDVNLINNGELKTQTWDNSKPYVIYGRASVGMGEVLTINPGAKVYFHRKGSIYISGTLKVNGIYGSQVVFASDRLEKEYFDVPGQWDGLFFSGSSSGNVIDNAIIRNSIFGLTLNKTGTGNTDTGLLLLNSDISHSTVTALTAVNSTIVAANCIFSHCGKFCIYLASGGNYSFTHCTVSNLWDYGFRLSPAVSINEGALDPFTLTAILDFNLLNSVVYGDLKSEVEILPVAGSFSGNYLFDHCLLKLDTLNSVFWSPEIFPGAIINRDPLFIDPGNYDFRPDTLSPLLNAGSDLYKTKYPLDIRQVSRIDDAKADIGAYERVAGEKRKER
jgi:hypothetical protein